jgi:hypothetical protein
MNDKARAMKTEIVLINANVSRQHFDALVFYFLTRCKTVLNLMLGVGRRDRRRIASLAYQTAKESVNKEFGNEIALWSLELLRDAAKRGLL